jgi:protein-disulfide isomerase
MTTPRSQRRPARQKSVSTFQILLVVGAAVVAAALLIFLNSSRLRQTGGGALAYPTGVTQDGHAYKGLPDAPLKLILYSDFLCGHCAEFATALDNLIPDYVETGKLQVIYYNFAFLTPESVQAAKGSLCALDQGAMAFWRYHDLLFAYRDSGMVAYSNSRLKGYAGELGLDSVAFNRCFDTNAKAAQVQADLDAGRQQGVEATPTWFLNGQREVGSKSDSDLRALFDGMLKK